MFLFLGGIMLTSAVAIGIPGIIPEEQGPDMTVTGTPLDLYSDADRPIFCESGIAKSNTYVTEYKIPTPCTQPLAITTDSNGNVWFAQVNTGKVAKFVPITESFTEYDNPQWPLGARSMIWGIDYSPDNSIWFTDEAHNTVWKFSIDDETYTPNGFPEAMDSLPQRLQVVGSKVIVNDFSGNFIAFLDPASEPDSSTYLKIPSPVPDSFTGGFALDRDNNLWYTNWAYLQGGVLVKVDITEIEKATTTEGIRLLDYSEIFQFPPGLSVANGVSIGDDGKVWILDTASSFFFSFDPSTKEFTKYITSDPPLPSYGNATGVIKTPVSRPYWNDFDNDGRMVFNEQTANRIGVFDISSNTLIEYLIPSKNPNWADCEGISDCGLAQVFDFTIQNEKIWFTEWVENNIGYVDTSVDLPFTIDVTSELSLKKGESVEVVMELTKTVPSSKKISLISSSTANFSDIVIDFSIDEISGNDLPQDIPVTITINDNALSGTHKVLVGAQTDEVTISKYITVIIE